MCCCRVVTVLLLCGLILGFKAEDLNTNKFPDGFIFGVATAAYQIEGAYNEDGKGENIWDNLTHSRSEFIADGSNGDIACDSYHHLEEDVAMIKDLGVDFYRFSLSWSRILPKGYSYDVNSAGIKYYNDLIDALLEEGIEPMVTLYHWDLPQVLQDMGGWANELMVDYFTDYAKVAFENFGDRVKTWITFNEPFNVCHQGYGNVLKAPALNLTGIADYMCTHTVLKSHAKVWHLYDEEYRATQKGNISITLDTSFFEPLDSSSQSDVDAADRMLQFTLGWYAHPIFSDTGDYPSVMKEIVANRSRLEGFNESRLPTFTDEEISYIKGTYDFFGLNVYTTKYATTKDYPIGITHWNYDTSAEVSYDDDWQIAASEWLRVVPWGFRKLLNWVKDQYGDVDIYITENGYSDWGEEDDVDRIVYLELYMSAMLDAIYEDNVTVKAYTIWSLMDNFEWFEGYTHYFGLYKVDFNSDERTRTPKTSVGVIKDIIKDRQLPQTTYKSDGLAINVSIVGFVAALLFSLAI